jgi:hypothetical protein
MIRDILDSLLCDVMVVTTVQDLVNGELLLICEEIEGRIFL